ncbi:hypothetical protein GRI58_07320 [Porphyrobacter algicida]|uniref:DUF1826 domain-containing protein n=1 Tax=Qipengyuania algicida TaxID=1836209 RepID=A0A845AGN4_9SPHN|nr:DUF6445 family protein [Qipengyuania algicida]MXP28627.1 hypothetical protein [Qipengyuania algicida]
MKPQRLLVGTSRTPVLIVDETGTDCPRIRSIARNLGPFPSATNNYPGLRRIIDETDDTAWAYVRSLLEAMTPFLGGAFDLDGFELIEASFSLVTTPSHELSSVQRMPHFDSVEPDFYAVMQYLAPCEGTAFYRHRTSGVETVTPAEVHDFIAQARHDSHYATAEYIYGDTEYYETIARVEGHEGRLVAYPGRLLHSGLIPADFVGNVDPEHGRLTCNFFIRSRRND